MNRTCHMLEGNTKRTWPNCGVEKTQRLSQKAPQKICSSNVLNSGNTDSTAVPVVYSICGSSC